MELTQHHQFLPKGNFDLLFVGISVESLKFSEHFFKFVLIEKKFCAKGLFHF